MANYKLISFDKIPSTQTRAHEMIASGTATDHMAIVAHAQSAGRGRYRRTWVSHHGNLYVSFIYNSPERDARLSYSVAVAIAETLAAFGISPNIKWPNDILVSGKKISGVLIEYSGAFVICGIGINIKNNPTVPEYKTTKMLDYCSDIAVLDVLRVLMRNMDKWMHSDFASVRARWMEMAIGLNQTVRYRGNAAKMIGLNENGALILRHDKQYFLVYGDEITL
ncbi:MAG: biotin--[Alphaproteobacteria bacterium]|nr:biotin--[acetyl-CoA-carboxylase] ligase [Alphaproteobacteria bacterium]